jgi:hypothetical protein
MTEDTDFSAFKKGSNGTKTFYKSKKKGGMLFQDKKKKERLSIYICSDIKSKVKKLADKHGCAESSIVEQCLDKILSKVEV